MICPVTEPMYFEAGSKPLEGREKVRGIYLPEGTKWYDFYTGENYEGGQTVTVDAPIERIPVFVRAGSIIPAAAPGNSVEETLDGEIELLVYPGADVDYDFYEDAGDGYGYEQGEYAVTHMEWNDKEGKLSIGEPVSPGGFQSKKRKFKVVKGELK